MNSKQALGILKKNDTINQMILLTVIPLSGFHCINTYLILTKFFSGGNFNYAAVIVTHGSRNVMITDNIVKNSHVGISIGNFFLFTELKKLKPIRKLFIVF
jgi:hypothetical protein